VRRHHDRHTGLAKDRQDRGGEVVIDVVQVGHIGPEFGQQPTQLVLSLEGPDHLRRLDDLLHQRIAVPELDLVDEEPRPLGRKVLRVVHREEGIAPAEALHQRRMLEVDVVRPATMIVVAVDREQPRGGFDRHAAPWVQALARLRRFSIDASQARSS
jgi:hypothetical protein